MSREEAQQLILEKLDEVQQILEKWDPNRITKWFDVTLKREANRTSLNFRASDPAGRAILEYTE